MENSRKYVRMKVSKCSADRHQSYIGLLHHTIRYISEPAAASEIEAEPESNPQSVISSEYGRVFMQTFHMKPHYLAAS